MRSRQAVAAACMEAARAFGGEAAGSLVAVGEARSGVGKKPLDVLELQVI